MRVSDWYTLGAKKYGDNNWRKGQPVSRCAGSLLRHLTKYFMGQTDEDHLSAVVFNALSIMNIDQYFNGTELDDWHLEQQVTPKTETKKAYYLDDDGSQFNLAFYLDWLDRYVYIYSIHYTEGRVLLKFRDGRSLIDDSVRCDLIARGIELAYPGIKSLDITPTGLKTALLGL
jgi:hypothetical protein